MWQLGAESIPMRRVRSVGCRADVITALARGIKQRVSPEFVARLRTELERKVAKPDSRR